MKKTTRWLLGIVLMAAAATAIYLWLQVQRPPPQSFEPLRPTSQAPKEPAIRYPIPEEAQAQAVPPLDDSDASVRDALAGVIGRKALKDLFYPERIVRHIVVTVDNLPRKTAAVRLFPVKPAAGTFRTTKSGQGLVISAQNAARYTPYVRIAEAVDSRKLVDTYMHYYPLFQRAYRELGYPDGYFNDRLVAVIDHLLAAPEVEGPIAVVQPHVMYRFADPALETASAGHKIMIRMGRGNAMKVKNKLQEIRGELTRVREEE